jgi:ectoine hydroxylase-related dioxygenase (phytanoyl-CoA dioxygenase family)
VVWIPLDPVPKSAALEIVRGSHKGTTYNGSLFHAKDDTVGLYKGDPLPRLPDIEAHRDEWNDKIVSWASGPGDVLIFHTASLHGGGATLPGMRRRSLTLRFVGDDVVRVARPKRRGEADQEPGDRFERLPLGASVWQSGIRKVHPWT